MVELTSSDRTGPPADIPHDVRKEVGEERSDRSREDAINQIKEGPPRFTRILQFIEPRHLLYSLSGHQRMNQAVKNGANDIKIRQDSDGHKRNGIEKADDDQDGLTHNGV